MSRLLCANLYVTMHNGSERCTSRSSSLSLSYLSFPLFLHSIPSSFLLFLPVVVLNSDSSSFSCPSCSCGHTIPIRAGVLTSLCTARLPLSCPRIKAPKSSPAAQHALIRRSLAISKIACVPHVHRTISRRVLSALSPYVRRPSPLAPCRYRPGTPVLFDLKSYSSRHSLPSVFLRNYCTTHARLITLRTFASLSISFCPRKFSRKDYGSFHGFSTSRRKEKKRAENRTDKLAGRILLCAKD